MANRNRGRSSRRGRWIGSITGLIVAVVAGLLVAVLTGNDHFWPFHSAASEASFDKPDGPVTYPWTLTGRVKNANNVDLWLDIQGDGERNHRPANKPCTLESNGNFTCETLYIGQKPPVNQGAVFNLTLYSVVKGSDGDVRLTAYGNRDVKKPGAYVGLPSMPADATRLNDLRVTRG